MSRHLDFSKEVAMSFRWRRPFVAALVLLFVGSASSHLLADEIYFTSGYSQTGVVIRETETYLRFKTEMGLVTISQEKINFVEKASDEENQAMLKKWREKVLREEEQLDAKREAEREYEIQQIKKGLVNFEDEWMTPERRQEILSLRKEARAHRTQFERRQIEKGLAKFQHIWVTPVVEQQLIEMEEEIEALVEQIEGDKVTVESFRSAMLNVPSFTEAEELGKKIEEINEKIEKNTKKLNLLFKKADDIAAVSVKYTIPDKYMDVLPPEEAFE
jgi:hypothetical protein